MRSTYIVIAGAFTLLGVITAFSNIMSQGNYVLLLKTSSGPLFFPFLVLFIIGFMGGVFAALAKNAGKNSGGGGTGNDDFDQL